MIVSTTLAGPGSEAIIGDALRSVLPIVDRCLILNTSNSSAPTNAAWDAVGMMKVVTSLFDWTGSFADARNFALEFARREGAEYALTIDADERLLDVHPQGWANLPFEDVVMCYDEHRTYAKERLIRLPLKPGAKWVGPVHECFLPGDGAKRVTFDGWRVRELPKTPGQLKAKFERDLVALEKQTEEEPNDPRWWFYLGETLKGLGLQKQAADAFATCIAPAERGERPHQWDEEAAWCHYRLAEWNALAGRHHDAIRSCLGALQWHPGFAEAAWLAGWCSYQLGSDRNAIYWSRMAKAIAEAEKLPELSRIGFRHLPAYRDGPQSVEDFAWKRLKKL